MPDGINPSCHAQCPLGKDIVAEVVGNGQCPAIIAGQIRPSPWGKEDVPHGVNEHTLVGLWGHCRAPEPNIEVN